MGQDDDGGFRSRDLDDSDCYRSAGDQMVYEKKVVLKEEDYEVCFKTGRV